MELQPAGGFHPYILRLLNYRMAWLVTHGPRQFPMRQWRRVFFTDESRFTLFRPDGRRRVYRRHGGTQV
jgi:hypothetical protein